MKSEDETPTTPASDPKEKSATSSGRRYRQQQYREEWEQNPLFSAWLSRCRVDSTRVICKACDCKILCRFASIQLHANTVKHKKCLSNFDDGRELITTPVPSDDDDDDDDYSEPSHVPPPKSDKKTSSSKRGKRESIPAKRRYRDYDSPPRKRPTPQFVEPRGDFLDDFARVLAGYLRKMPDIVSLELQQNIMNQVIQKTMEFSNCAVVQVVNGVASPFSEGNMPAIAAPPPIQTQQTHY